MKIAEKLPFRQSFSTLQKHLTMFRVIVYFNEKANLK
jgi:hypothetical protein